MVLFLLAFLFWSALDISGISLAQEEFVPLRQESFRNRLPENLADWLREHENTPLRLGILDNWPPFMMQRGRTPEGFSLEYLRSLGELLGVSFVFIEARSWEELIPLLRNGEVDLLPGIWQASGGEEMLLTKPYYESPLVLVHASEDRVSSEAEIPELPFAVMRGYGGEEILEEVYPQIPRLYVSSSLEGLEAVFRGEARGYLEGREMAEYLLGTSFLPNLVIRDLEDPRFEAFGKICMGVRRDWPELAAILDIAMEHVSEEEYENLLKNWLHLPLSGVVLPELTRDEREWLQKHAPFRTCSLCVDLPPFWSREKCGIPRGYAAQILRKIQGDLNISMIPLPQPVDEEEKALRKKSADILPLVQPLRAREAGFLYTSPYLSIPTVIVVRDPKKEIRSLSDTKDLVVAVDNAPHLQTLFTQGHPFSQKKEYSSAEEALVGVSRGEAECYIGNLATASFFIKKHDLTNLHIFPEPTLPPLFLSFGIRQDYHVLENIFNRCVEKIGETQKYALLEQYHDSGVNTSFHLFPHEREWLQSLGPLRIGIDPDWPPLEFLGEYGSHEGIVSDYLALIQKDLQISLDYVGTRSWRDTMEKAARGEVDMVPGLNDLPERRAFLAFTDPYLKMPLVIAAHKDAGYIGGLESLGGKTAGVVKGYAVNDILFEKYPDIRFVSFSSIGKALEALDRRQVHAVIQSNLVLSYYIRLLGMDSLQIVAATSFADLLSMGVRRDLAPLVPILNRLLGSITENEKELILDKWITRPLPGYVNWQKIWSIVFTVSGVGFFFVVFMLFWNRKLAREVAERQKVERKLEEQKMHAESANRAKSVFLANMSHEIRTPLNAILGYTQLMKRDPSLSGNHREFVDTIGKSGEHLLHLISDILEMSKIEAGRMDLEEGAFDLYGMLSHMEKLFAVELEHKGVFFEVRRSPEVPRYLFGDEKKVRQVLLNILGNAVKFTSRGRIFFEIESRKSGSRQREILFKVRDSGPGIPEEDLEKIFEPFEQTREGIDRGGTGLGLPISRHYARLMGGNLVLENAPSGGALCIFTFLANEMGALEEDALQSPSGSSVLKLLSPENPPLLLVVDDRKSNRNLLRHLLEDVGFRVGEASDGLEAVQYLESTLPQGILLDRRMPGMDGLELLGWLRGNERTASIPVVMVSASVMEEDRAEVLRQGADAFIRKPFKEEELLEILRTLLSVEYLYGKPPGEEEHLPVSEIPGESRKALSPETATRFHNALESGETSLLEKLIEEEMTPLSPELGEIFKKLLKEYDYETMLGLLEEGKKGDFSEPRG